MYINRHKLSIQVQKYHISFAEIQRVRQEVELNVWNNDPVLNVFFSGVTLPVSAVRCRAKSLKLSMSGVRIPCMVPNMVLSPKLSSIRKNRVDQKGLAGKRAITSVKAMNARPVPSTPYIRKK